MKKIIYMLPAFALMLFAACSSEDAVTTESKAQLNETPDNAIGFGAYINRTTTRAGAPGILTTNGTTPNVSLQNPDVGFGVFGYYADGDLYSENALPNFMYNQWVRYQSSEWKYDPVKYWPNEFGTSAVSTGVDRVTFFAYAPYVEVTPNTGQLTSQYNDDGTAEKSTTSGITSLTRNGKTGDPYVRYVGAFNPDECVDLCYGVAGENFVSSAGEGDGANDISMGQPYLNVAKPAIGSRINFLFKHALAQLTVNVDADVDIVGHDDGDAYADNMTRVWVRSVTFNGIAPKGYFNLHSGYWYDAIDNEKISRASVTVYDKRRDGSEATAEDTYESPTGLNPNLVQSEVYGATIPDGSIQYGPLPLSVTKGVTAQNQYLFDGTGTILVIPANEQMKVTIVYDVETADATLPTYLSDGKTKGSTVENKITKEITIGGDPLKLESGKAYTLNLHLGLTGVKFNATVSGWDPAPGDADVDLPHNKPLSIAAGDPFNNQNVNVSADATSYKFTVTGLTPSTTVTCNKDNTVVTGCTGEATTTDASGSITATATFAANTKLTKKEGWASVGISSNGGKITITQAAAPLGLNKPTVNNGATSITLTATNTDISGNWDDTSNVTVEVKRGEDVISSGITSAGVVTISSVATDEVLTIKVKAFDADEETVTVTVGSGS